MSRIYRSWEDREEVARGRSSSRSFGIPFSWIGFAHRLLQMMRWYYCVLFKSEFPPPCPRLLSGLHGIPLTIRNVPCRISSSSADDIAFIKYTPVIASLKLLQWTLLGDKNHVPVQSSFSEFTSNNNHRPEVALVRMRAKVKARKKQMAFLQNVFPIEICKQLTYFTTTTTRAQDQTTTGSSTNSTLFFSTSSSSSIFVTFPFTDTNLSLLAPATI